MLTHENGSTTRRYKSRFWRAAAPPTPRATPIAAVAGRVDDSGGWYKDACGAAKRRLWHGRWPGCRRKLAALCRWARTTSSRGLAGIGPEHRVGEMLACRERNQEAPVHYAARRRNDEPVSTAFVERSVNEIIARRMNKKQQMGWNRTERRCSPSPTCEQRRGTIRSRTPSVIAVLASTRRMMNEAVALAT